MMVGLFGEWKCPERDMGLGASFLFWVILNCSGVGAYWRAGINCLDVIILSEIQICKFGIDFQASRAINLC